jgi:crotonobetainyl-CoA:carnitine CoA-transferase CaiB-like acyl-CoA transferase
VTLTSGRDGDISEIERAPIIMGQGTWKGYAEKKHSKPLPLRGIRVLEVCTLLLGPSGPGFLARLGAEVIKCEMPPFGDTLRSLVPFGYFFKDQSTSFIRPNPNKYWVGLDLHTPEGQEVFRELAAKADIIEENLRPGVLERWNVGYRQIKEINPSIIYISKTGFGQWGQYARENRPSNDGAAQAMSGYSWMSSFPGQQPIKNRLYICDSYGALMGEVAVLAALHYRDRTGKGQFIELSQSESIMRTMSWVWPYQQITGEVAMPAGNRDVSICPADTFYCADEQFVALAAPSPEEFGGLCIAMGRPELADDPRFRDHATRLQEENAIEILGIIAEWVRTKTVEEVEALAEKHGFAATRLYNIKDVVEDEHFRARGFVKEIDDPLLGQFLDYEFPVMMSKTPPRVSWTIRPVGFDNEYVMTNTLGKSEDEIEQLYDCGALGKWADVRGRRPPPDWDGKAGLIMARD